MSENIVSWRNTGSNSINTIETHEPITIAVADIIQTTGERGDNGVEMEQRGPVEDVNAAENDVPEYLYVSTK